MKGANGLFRGATIAVALLGAGACLAAAVLRASFSHGGSWTDGTTLVSAARADGARRVLWEGPAPLEVSEPLDLAVREPSFAPDGRTIVFAAGAPGRNLDLYVGLLEGGRVAEARPLASLDSPFDDRAPALDEEFIYFASDRPGGTGKLDLWRARWNEGSPGEAEPVRDSNSPQDDTDPALDPATGALAFASDRAGGFDLYLAEPSLEGGFREPLLFRALSSPAADLAPAFRPDGGAILFASDRAGGGRGFDLFVSGRDPRIGWTAPEPLEPFATSLDETDPALSPEGFFLLLGRSEREGTGEIALARSREILPAARRGPSMAELLALAALLLLVALLAWLGKRWKALDLLSKCLLLSILLHLLLLMLSRRVRLTQEVEAREPKGRTFRVKVLPVEDLARASRRERGEKIEVARAEAPSAERAEPEAGEEPSPAPSLSAAAAAAALPSPEALAQAQTPARASPEEPSREAGETGPPPFKDRDADAESKRTGGAPSLTVAALDLSGATRRGPRAERAAPPREAEGGAPAPGSIEIEASRATIGPVAVGRAAISDFRPETPSGAAPLLHAPAVPAPTARKEGASPSLALAPAEIASARGPEGTPPPDFVASSRGTPAPAPASTDIAAPSPSWTPGPVASPARAVPERSSPIARGPEMKSSSPPDLDEAPREGERAPPPSLLGEPAAFGKDAAPAFAPRRETFAAADATPSPRPAEISVEVPRPRLENQEVRPAPRLEGTPYDKRSGVGKEVALREFGGTPETEKAVADGLRYLASIQRRTGGWGRAEDRNAKYRDTRIGRTGLALLAFLGAGHTQQSGTDHSAVVSRAIRFLLDRQDAETGHFGDSEAYGHGIAAYALGEAYAMTKDSALRGPLERAVGRILETQQRRRDPRFFGGWSYYYPDGSIYDEWPRASITAWQVMALESARLSGLEIADEAFRAARAYLERSFDEEFGYFRYCHDPERLRSGYRTLPGSTPASIFALTLLGAGEDPRVEAALPFVRGRRPSRFRPASEERFVSRGEGNVYFWSYATLAFFQRGGPDWPAWNEAMKRTLVPAQEKDGSWPPVDPYAGIAGDDEADRSYTTAMCVLMLEVYYRYVTPLLRWHPSMPGAAEASPASGRRPV